LFFFLSRSRLGDRRRPGVVVEEAVVGFQDSRVKIYFYDRRFLRERSM
jgi:hypothetical protein